MPSFSEAKQKLGRRWCQQLPRLVARPACWDGRDAGGRISVIHSALGAEAFRGHDGLRELVAAVLEGADSWAAEIGEARIRRDGVLLIDYMNRLQTSGSIHMELTYKGWQEIEVRDGLIASVAQFEHAPPGWDGATLLSLGLTPDTGT